MEEEIAGHVQFQKAGRLSGMGDFIFDRMRGCLCGREPHSELRAFVARAGRNRFIAPLGEADGAIK
jgi:hypothetical protein